jgi:L-fuconolactonase
VLAVVGWTDLTAPDAPSRIATLARRPKLRGLRPMLQALADDTWILHPALAPAIEAMIDQGLSFDALILPRHLPHLLTFAQRWPGLSIVIDHGAKPAIAAGTLDPWRPDIAALAGEANVFCKLSGLLTEAAPGQSPTALAPYVAHLVQTFGPGRLMWGSDWPVLDLAGDYAAWRMLAQDLSGLSDPADLAALFGETARRFYRL